MMSAARMQEMLMRSETEPGRLAFDFAPSLGELVDRTAEGIGNIVFQKRVATGLLVLAGIFVSSWTAAMGCAFGAALATLVASWLRTDRKILDSGVFGLNGALTGIALFTLTGMGSTLTSLFSLNTWLWATTGVLISAVLASALFSWLLPKRLPVFAAAYCAATWLCIAALRQFPGLSVSVSQGDFHTASLTGPSGVWGVLLNGATNGISGIFAQHGWLSTLLILLAIAIQSRFGAMVAAGGAVAGSATAYALGAPDSAIQSGLYSCNAALTAVFLGAILRGRPGRRFSYALAGAIAAVLVSAACTSFLQPFGLPILLFPTVLVGWISLAAGMRFASFSNLLPEQSENDKPSFFLGDVDLEAPENAGESELHETTSANAIEGGHYHHGTSQA